MRRARTDAAELFHPKAGRHKEDGPTPRPEILRVFMIIPPSPEQAETTTDYPDLTDFRILQKADPENPCHP
jgi:hypothetical protein